jgi:hypothetical protein
MPYLFNTASMAELPVAVFLAPIAGDAFILNNTVPGKKTCCELADGFSAKTDEKDKRHRRTTVMVLDFLISQPFKMVKGPFIVKG